MTQDEYLQAMTEWANGERMVPELFTGGLSNVISHFSHWNGVREQLEEGDLGIELGCGCGLPARIYSLKTKREFVAVDRPEVVAQSEAMYPTPGVRFVGVDLNQPGWEELIMAWADPFDVVVSIDVIEHVADHRAFLAGMARIGHEGTRYIIDAPVGVTAAQDPNPWHLHHWETTEAFEQDLYEHLPSERVVHFRP